MKYIVAPIKLNFIIFQQAYRNQAGAAAAAAAAAAANLQSPQLALLQQQQFLAQQQLAGTQQVFPFTVTSSLGF